MRVGVILYHKDILNIYKQAWILKCLHSLQNQSFKNFTVYELCYGKVREQWWEGSNYSHIPMDNHIHALNHILDKAFLDGCDVVANVNLDDFFNYQRLELQLAEINKGYDLVSSNFDHIQEIDGTDTHIRSMIFHDRNIRQELNNSHNILAHPVIMMTSKFWEKYKYYDTNQLGFEDLTLWRRAANDGCKIKIIDKILLHYRLSDNQTSKIYNAQGVKTK